MRKVLLELPDASVSNLTVRVPSELYPELHELCFLFRSIRLLDEATSCKALSVPKELYEEVTHLCRSYKRGMAIDEDLQRLKKQIESLRTQQIKKLAAKN